MMASFPLAAAKVPVGLARGGAAALSTSGGCLHGRRMMSSSGGKKMVVNVVCPKDAPALGAMANFREGVDFVVGNSMADFAAQPRAKEAESLMFVATGGDPKVMTPLLKASPKVKWCHSLFAGVDALAPFIAESLRPSGLPLTNGKGAFSESLGEYVLASALHFNKKVPACLENRKAKKWDKFVMPVLAGKTMGFVGFGHIGQTAARMARKLGIKVLALRRNTAKSGDADEVLGLDRKRELFERSDFVVSVLPGTPDTVNFCGAAEFAAMKPDAVFISCGRGTVVDEDALAACLKAGKIAGAAMDVFKVEPLPLTSPLWDCENLLLTAHNADYTEDYFDLGWQVWRSNFDAQQAGTPYVTPVNLDDGY